MSSTNVVLTSTGRERETAGFTRLDDAIGWAVCDWVCEFFEDEEELSLAGETPERLSALAQALLEAADYIGDHPPRFVFDVSDRDVTAAWTEWDTDVIHLHPRLITWDNVIHELAHVIDHRQGHGPRFIAHLLNLTAAKFGSESAGQLATHYEANDVGIAWDWVDSAVRS